MSGSHGGFSIGISATDAGATAFLQKLNREIANLTAPAERASKAMRQFGDVSGISRLSEGMQSLSKTAADAFRSIDQTGTSLSSLIGPLTLTGMDRQRHAICEQCLRRRV